MFPNNFRTCGWNKAETPSCSKSGISHGAKKTDIDKPSLPCFLPPRNYVGWCTVRTPICCPLHPLSPILWYWHSPLYCAVQKCGGTVKERGAGCEACAWVPAPWPASVVVLGDLWQPLSNPPGPQFRPLMSTWQQVVVIQAWSPQRSKASFGVSVSGTKWCCPGVFHLCVAVQSHRLISGLLPDGH